MRLIQTYKADMLNGVGLRNVYFFSGCTHNCKGCFNPETHDPFMSRSRLWNRYDFEQMIEDTDKDYIDGITLTGGDPLSRYNEDDILLLCKKFKERLPHKTIWIYTGYTFEAIMMAGSPKTKVMDYVDVLCDGPYIDSEKSPEKPWVGSSNQRVIDVQKTLAAHQIVLWQ